MAKYTIIQYFYDDELGRTEEMPLYTYPPLRESKAIDIVTKELLKGDWAERNGLYQSKKNPEVSFKIQKIRFIDRINPCKPESGKIGGWIHDSFSYVSSKINTLLKGNIQCECCEAVNTTIVKYSGFTLLIYLIPYAEILAMILLVIMMSLRNTT